MTPGRIILVNGDDPNALAATSHAFTPVETFGLGDGCRWRAANIAYGSDGTAFDVMRDGTTAAYPPFYSAALTQAHTAPWAYPLVPLCAVFDAATNPVLLFFAPVVIVTGD